MEGQRDYFPVQRIAQACLSCRRKKCRCTGDKPICGHCRRLGIDCVYDYADCSKRSSGLADEGQPGMALEDVSVADAILRKLAALDEKMNTFGQRLHNIESNLASASNHSRNGIPKTGTPGWQMDTNLDLPGITDSHNDHLHFQREASQIMEDKAPKGAIMAVVDAYFYFCHNQPYSFFHEGTFRRNLSEQKIPAHLLSAVVATAARFCTHSFFSTNTYETSVEYANRAWKLIVSDCFTAGKVTQLSTVQTVALLGLFDFTAGKSRHGSAWVKVGMAVRIAQDCGLMLETATHLPYVEQEERRRVFWSVYLLDRLVSCGRGRPPAIVDASCHLQLPCEESVWKDGLWSKTQTLDEITNRNLTLPQRESSFAQVIAISQILGRSSQYMLQSFNIRSPHPPWDPSSDFAALESDLLHFETYLQMNRPLRDVLSPHITPDGVVDCRNIGPILFSRALYHLCYCLLNHPFLLRRRIDTCRSPAPVSFIARSLDLGWLHAQQMLEFVAETRELGCSFHSSSSGYCVTVAGSIIALKTYDPDPVVSGRAQGLLDEALGYLDLLGNHWGNVLSMAVVLRRMVYDGFLGSNLCSRQPQIAPLSPAEEETMWAVVDYNTMSSETTTEVAGSGPGTMNIWPDSMTELFGTIDYQLVAGAGGVGGDLGSGTGPI